MGLPISALGGLRRARARDRLVAACTLDVGRCVLREYMARHMIVQNVRMRTVLLPMCRPLMAPWLGGDSIPRDVHVALVGHTVYATY